MHVGGWGGGSVAGSTGYGGGGGGEVHIEVRFVCFPIPLGSLTPNT